MAATEIERVYVPRSKSATFRCVGVVKEELRNGRWRHREVEYMEVTFGTRRIQFPEHNLEKAIDMETCEPVILVLQ